MRIIMLGAPGVGKGSQAVKIAKFFAIPHISTGDLFREQINAKTEIGQKVKSYMDEGKLVPDEITISMLTDRIEKEDCEEGFVLDGFPRTLQQAIFLDKTLKNMNMMIDVALYLSLEDDLIIRRIIGRRTCSSCGTIYHTEDIPPKKEDVCDCCLGELVCRADDTTEVIQRRLAVYHEQTQPLIEYYFSSDRLIQIESDKQIENTTSRVFKSLDKYITERLS